MIVLVCGDRHWSDRQAIRRRLAQLPLDTTVVHGAASGADSIAGEEAKDLGFKVVEFPAEWAKYGRAAGPKRNSAMLAYIENSVGISIVLAFHHNISESRGTADTVRKAKAGGIKTIVFRD